MIDDRICIFYVADRLDEIVKTYQTKDVTDAVKLADEFLRELNHNIGVNARWKRNNPDALTADLPPIDPPKRKRGRPRK